MQESRRTQSSMPMFQKHLSQDYVLFARDRENQVFSPPIMNEPSLKNTEGFIRKGLIEDIHNTSRAFVSVIQDGVPVQYSEFEEIKALNEELNAANDELERQKLLLEEALISIRKLRKNKLRSFVKITRNVAAITGGITALWQLIKFIIFLING